MLQMSPRGGPPTLARGPPQTGGPTRRRVAALPATDGEQGSGKIAASTGKAAAGKQDPSSQDRGRSRHPSPQGADRPSRATLATSGRRRTTAPAGSSRPAPGRSSTTTPAAAGRPSGFSLSAGTSKCSVTPPRTLAGARRCCARRPYGSARSCATRTRPVQ